MFQALGRKSNNNTLSAAARRYLLSRKNHNKKSHYKNNNCLYSSSSGAAAAPAVAVATAASSQISGVIRAVEKKYYNNNNGGWMKAMGVAAVAGACGWIGSSQEKNHKADCCGIAGVVGTEKDDARDFLLEALTILKNRGYDSAGLSTMPPGGGPMVTTKFASDSDKADGIELVSKHSSASAGHNVGIAHTRWATHGGILDKNAHPHVDSSDKIALVHNGNLNNAEQLRRNLEQEGHFFVSNTDTEVIAKLIGHYYEKQQQDNNNNNNKSLKAATEQALVECDGTWGLCIMCTDAPDELVVACNGSPLVIGIAQDRTFVASEVSTFYPFTKRIITLKDGEIGVVRADGTTLDQSRKQEAPHQEIQVSPHPHPHWTLKEILEQPEAIARSLAFGSRLGTSGAVMLGSLETQRDTLSKIRHMVMSACGTSLHAAIYGELIMKSLGSFDTVNTIDASDFDANDFPCDTQKKEQAGVLVASQSGETKDVHGIVVSAIDKGINALSVVNNVGSTIAGATKTGVYCHAGRENAVTSTKAFTCQVTVFALIALWFRQLREKTEGHQPTKSSTNLQDSLMRTPISFGMALRTREHCKRIAERLENKEHCFVLGKGYGYPVALEGALKIKEMALLHAEGYSGGALKHGPFALIENGVTGKSGATPIIMLIFDDQHAHHMRTAAEEVKARGADLVVITDKPELARDLDDDPIVVPNNGPLTALGAIIPLQLIAYELAMLREINPDTPRNLAKTHTGH